MQKIVTYTMALAFIACVTAATAGAEETIWPHFMDIKTKGLQFLEAQRKARCPFQKPEARMRACNISFDVMVTRRIAERAHAELQLIAQTLPRMERAGQLKDALLAMAPVTEYERMDSLTTFMYPTIEEQFPLPKKTAVK